MRFFPGHGFLVALLIIAFMSGSLPAGSQRMIVRGTPARNTHFTPPPPAATEDILLSEDFESGELPGAQWEIIDNNPDENWFVGRDVDQFMNGTYIAWVNFDEDDESDEWIITPEIDLEEVVDPRLYFSRFYGEPYWAQFATLYVRISTDGGTSYPDTIYTITTESLAGCVDVELSLEDYEDESIMIGFQYAGMDGDSVGLDDIYVTDGELTGVQLMSWGAVKSSMKKK